jgi:dihydrodipicolinate synthase/N-acetylneuraminate lyase
MVAGNPARRLPPTALATCVVPWDDRLRFAEEDFRAHVRLVAAHMTRHLYIFGTAGEGYAVTDAQFRDIARVFWDEAGQNGVTPMLGVISNSLGTVIERLEFGLELGYRQFQVSFPSWGRVSDPERDTFFRETCGRFTQAQFLHYNTPRGGRVLTGAEYGQLAREYASLAAVKFTSSDAAVVAELVQNAAPVQCFLTEPAYVLANGDCGLLVSLSGARLDLPGRFMAARGASLRELGALAKAIDELLEDSFRAACPAAHMDGAYEKVLARAHGARLALRLLPPYQGASEEAYRRFESGLGLLPGLERRSLRGDRAFGATACAARAEPGRGPGHHRAGRLTARRAGLVPLGRDRDPRQHPPHHGQGQGPRTRPTGGLLRGRPGRRRVPDAVRPRGYRRR